MRRAAAIGLALGLGLACSGNPAAPSPFATGGSSGAANAGGTAGGSGRGGTSAIDDPTIGGPCIDDGQCDDGVDCTDDACDNALGRCRYQPMNAMCADSVFCNGIEVCEPGVGCRAGDPVTCSDNSSCTIDRCIEETKSCEHAPHDADGDGDPVWNCGGGDCDDGDPEVSSEHPEVCGNAVDDNCDQAVDESDCVSPQHDTCIDALTIDAAGRFDLSLVAATEDAAFDCVDPGGTRRDVVVALTVPDGAPVDVDVVATSADEGLALALDRACTKNSDHLACQPAVPLPQAGNGNVARLVLRGLDPGVYPLYVSGLADSAVSLSVDYRDASAAPTNETCGSAEPLEPDAPVTADLSAAVRDLTSACDPAKSEAGELVYTFELSEPRDVVLRATALDDYGVPHLSLRSEGCVASQDELDCRRGSTDVPARLFTRALPAGTYFVALSASGPSTVELGLQTAPPTEKPANEGCTDPAVLDANVTMPVELSEEPNAVASECLPGAIDATYALSLDEPSYVLLVERLSAGDAGALSLMLLGCDPKTALTCATSSITPVRARLPMLAAGTYAVVAESQLGTPIELTALTRPATPSTLVPFADGCDDAIAIPDGGGRFSGNTNDATADYEASCDYGGSGVGGAADQMLTLHLDEPRRVILDLAGSDYATILIVRHADGCPGSEVTHACAPGRNAERSFLDLTLDAGDYYVQIDGFAGETGRWQLDAYLVDP